MTIQDAYEEVIQVGLSDLLRMPVTQATLHTARAIVEAVQRDFIYQYPEYVPARNITVEWDRFGTLRVDAPICTYREKLELDWREREQQRAGDEIRNQAELDNARQQRQLLHMQRNYRRLFRKHERSIPPGMRSVWNTLTEGQQYALLKDIDYAARHKATS